MVSCRCRSLRSSWSGNTACASLHCLPWFIGLGWPRKRRRSKMCFELWPLHFRASLPVRGALSTPLMHAPHGTTSRAMAVTLMSCNCTPSNRIKVTFPEDLVCSFIFRFSSFLAVTNHSLPSDFTELALNNAFPADISGLAFLTSLYVNIKVLPKLIYRFYGWPIICTFLSRGSTCPE